MKKSLKVKFSIAFGLMVVIALFMFISSMYTYNVSIPKMKDYTNSLSELNEFRYQFGEFNTSVEKYLNTGSTTDLESCQKLSQSLNVLCNSISDKYLNSNDETQSSLISAIVSSYPTYINQVQDLIYMDNTTQAIGLYKNKYSKNGTYIEQYIERLISYNYKVSSKSLDDTYSTTQIFQTASIVSFVLLALIIGILFKMTFKDVVTPIQKLARQSQQIANYNFDVENIQVNTKDEISSLVSMFNHMREKLKLMFDSNIKNLQMAEELLVQIQGNEELEKFVEYQKNLNDEMFKEANIDHLTNLMNKNAFIHCTDENIKSIDSNDLCALFVLDIDNL